VRHAAGERHMLSRHVAVIRRQRTRGAGVATRGAAEARADMASRVAGVTARASHVTERHDVL